MNEENSPLNDKNKTVLQIKQQAESAVDVTKLPEKTEEAIDTSMIDEQWASLSQDWQTQPFDKTDVQLLLKQTQKRTSWAKLCFGSNIVATVGLLVAFVYGVFQGELGKPWNTYLGVGGLLSVVFVYYEIKIRANTWRQINDSPDKAVENAIAGYQSSLRYMLLIKWSCLPFALLGNWLAFSMSEQANKPIWGSLIFVNGLIISMYVVTDYIHRKRKKELNELNSKISN